MIFAGYLRDSKKLAKFASLESATLPADQRTRAELLFYGLYKFST